MATFEERKKRGLESLERAKKNAAENGMVYQREPLDIASPYERYKEATKKTEYETYGGTANPVIRPVDWDKSKTYSQALQENKATRDRLSAMADGRKSTLQEVKDALFSGRNYTHVNPTYSFGNEYNTMTPEEAGTYMSLREQKGEAQAKEYMDALQIELNARNAQAARERAKAQAEKSTLAGIGLDVAGNIASGAGSLYSLYQQARNEAIDPYHPMMQGIDTKEGAHEALMAGKTGIRGVADEIGLMGLEWAGYLPMGALAPAAMAMGAGAQTARDAALRGATTEQAISLGVTAGAAETVSEMFSFNRLMKLIDKVPGGTKADVVRHLAKEMVSEGIQEGGTEAVNLIADMAIMGDKSQMAEIYNAAIANGMSEKEATAEVLKAAGSQVWESTYKGALTGGLIAGGVVGANKVTGKDPLGRMREQYEAATRQSETTAAEPVANPTVTPQNPSQNPVTVRETAISEELNNSPAEMRTRPIEAQKKLGDELEGYGEKFYGAKGAETYLKKAEESGNFDHTSAFNTYYRAGVAGIREDEIKQTAYTAVADKTMLHEAYMAGAADSATEIANAIKGKNKLTGKRGLILGDDVKATDAQMAMADFLGKTGGVQIRLVNRLEVTNDKGEVVGSANGKIEDGVITIALDADTFTGTAIHEMVHHIRKVNPTGYDAMRKLVFETANKIGVNMDKVMADYESTYRAAYGDKTSMMDIMEEVTADGFQKILNDKNAYKEFVIELQKVDKNLVAKIKEFLDKLMKTIESLLKDNRYTSFADVLGEDLESVKKLRKMFAEVLAETGKMEAGAEGAAADAKFSIRYTEDGRAVVVVDRDILKDLGEKEWEIDEWDKKKRNKAKSIAKNALKRFGEAIPVNGIQYRLNKDMRDEYAKANSETRLYRKDKTAFADKMRLADNADDVILATTEWKPEKAENPSKDYIKKFVKGDVLFISGGRKYKARTVVGVDMFGEHYFYDVTWVEEDAFKLKEESPSSVSGKAIDTMLGDSSENSVAQKGKDGNKKFSLRDSNGRGLSAGQREYFKDSKAVDENGRLLVMYHGTRRGEFESFKDWTYLTANRDYAERYTDKDTGKTMYEVYANIQKPFDTRLPEVRVIFEDEFMGVYGGTPLQESGLPDWTDGYDLAEFIEENGYDFDAILLDEGADPDGKGGVIERGVSYVIRSSEQAKDVKNLHPTSDKRLKFSMKEPVEETKNLIAVHGIYEENLKRVLDIGGFAMPSIAIIKDSMDHSKYGEISVVFGKETIDPKNKKNAVYGGDAWTPTIPGVHYEVNMKKEREFEREIWNLGNKILNGMFANSSILSGLGIEEWTDNTQNQIAHRLADRDAVMAAYAADKGIEVELEYRKKTGEPFHYELIEHYDEQKLAEMVAKFELDGELEEADVSEIRGMYQKDELDRLTKRYGHSKAKEEIKKKAQAFANIKVTPYSAGKVVKEAWELYLDGGKPTNEVDRLATQSNLSKAVNHNEVAEWVMPKLDGLLGDAGIYNGKDRYTPSGNRRSFKQLHHPYTLENLVKAMKANQKDRGEGLWGATASGLQSVTVPRYGSITEIKADSGRLQMMDDEEYQGKLAVIDDKISEIIKEVMATNKAYSDNSFWEMDSIGEILIQAAQKGSANAVKTHFSREGYTITDKLAKEIYGMAREAASLPTGYFEAKPQRAVGFDEVRAVVVPDNIGEETRARLEGEGMNVIEYAAGDDQSRMEALNSVPDVKFSVRDQKYLAAVESGDMEAAEKMVAAAAKDAGYTYKAYHGTFEKFNVFDIDRTNPSNDVGRGHYFSSDEEDVDSHYLNKDFGDVAAKIEAMAYEIYAAKGYDYEAIDPDRTWEYDDEEYLNEALDVFNAAYEEAEAYYSGENGRKIPVFLKIERPLYIKPGRVVDRAVFDGDKELDVDVYDIEELASRNYHDGIIDETAADTFDLKEGTIHYIVYDSENIKSADPVVRDDAGKIIPLSQRFDRKEADIRWSVRERQTERNTEKQKFSMKKESVEANIADSEHWKAAYYGLLREFEITREPLKDRESGRKVVSKFLKEIKSGYSEEDFLNRFMDLCNFGADMRSDSDYKDLVAAMAMLTEDALKESTDLDMEAYNKYAELRKHLRNGKLFVSRDTMKDLEAQDRKYTDLRKENFGRVTMSSKAGEAIDTQYAAWAEKYPELFKLDQHTSQAALLLDIIAVRNSLDPVVNNPYFDQLEDYAESYAYELLGRMNDIALEKPTFADKYEAELRKLREENKEALWKAREQAKHEKEMLRKRYADNAEARLEAAKQKYEKRMDRKEYWRLRKLAVKDAKALADWLKNPTDKNHVPKKFKEGVEKVLALIETDRPDLKIALQDFVAMKNGVMELYGDGQGMFLYRERDERVVDILDLFIQKYPNGANLDTMSGTDMKYFRELIASVKKACTDANKLHTSAREKSTVDLSEGFINESQKKKDARETGIIRRINDFLGLEMLDANSFFKRIGGNVYSELWKGLRKGMDKKVLRWKEAMDFINELVDPKIVREWTDEPAKEFEIGGVKVYLSIPQIMSLSCLMRRNQGRQHIVGAEIATETGILRVRGGGFKAEVLEGDKVAKKEKPKVVEPTEEEVKAIIGSLTEEQARVAYAMQKFLSENVAAWGNETTMLMFGYERFGEANYFPIVSDKNFVNEQVTKTEDITPTLRSMGLTKNLNQYANNPVIIQDIFKVFANHVDQMSNYNAFVPSESDFNKFLNFKVKNKEGRVFTVKDEMDRIMGKGGVKYIKNLMNRLVTANGLSDDIDLGKMLLRNMKVASVAANLRVILQQPTAYFRALNYIDPKYLLNPAVFKKADLNDVYENAPIALWKNWGNYEMDTGKSMYDQIIAPTKIGWTKDMMLAGAGWMDKRTWLRLWNACLLEARSENPKATDEEVKSIAGERFSEIVDESQVVDSVLHRSQIMRRKGLYTQMITSFLSEPTKTFNMASNALVEVVRNNTPENRKKFIRCYSTLIFSGIMTAFMASFADAFRDDDDEDEYLKKWLRAFAGDVSEAETAKEVVMARLNSNIGDNLNPLGMLPFLRDVWSSIQGYDIKRTDFDWLNDVLKNMSRWQKFAAGESEYTLMSMLLNTAGAWSKLTGLPVSSATRELKSIANMCVYHFAYGEPGEYTEAEFAYQKLGKAIGSEKNASYYIDRMLKAYMNGDRKLATKIYNEMIRAGIDNQKIDGKVESKMKSAMKDNPDILEAANAMANGDVKTLEAMADKMMSLGFRESEVASAINSAYNAMDDVEEELTYEEIDESYWGGGAKTVDDLMDNKMMFNAHKAGSTSNYDKIREKQIRAKMKDGKTRKEAENSVRTSMRNQYKAMYEKALEEGDSAAMKEARSGHREFGGKDATLDKLH